MQAISMFHIQKKKTNRIFFLLKCITFLEIRDIFLSL